MKSVSTVSLLLAVLVLSILPGRAENDPRAVEIARAVMDSMGGQQAWDGTRFVRWRFFGRRLHFWDRHTGDIRVEASQDDENYVILMNIQDKRGRAWKNGEPIAEGPELDEALIQGHQIWVNDSYWMFMPYKLLDPGVSLKYSGTREMEDGRPADVLELTFEQGVGYTPQNRYEVFVARDTGLIEQWAFFAEAADEEPRFTMPWADWQPFGEIKLATSHGRDLDWDIAVFDDLPASVFASPDPVSE